MPCDYKQYPKNWKTLRRFVLKRAENCCEACGVPNGLRIARSKGNPARWTHAVHPSEPDPSVWGKPLRVVLTIAHLDHDRGDDPRRLRALCQRCHLILDKQQHAESARRTREAKRGQTVMEVV